MGLFDSIKKIGKSIFGGGGSSGGGFGGFLDFAGTAIGLYSDYMGSKESKKLSKKQAKALQQAAKANAELSLYDASVAEKEAVEAFKATQRTLALHYRMADKLVGKQRTAVAKGGAVADTGTPLDVMEQTSQRLQEDARIIEYEGRKAQEQREALAHRYRMLAQAGLRDASASASLIEKTGDWQALSYRLQGIQRAVGYLGSDI